MSVVSDRILVSRLIKVINLVKRKVVKMTTLNTITLEPNHVMASSNTGNTMVFRNTVGNYISRKAYLEMLVSSQGVISHKYLSPNETRWVMNNKKVGN
ncbi:MAG: hypothetical protein EB127_26610 [Alphaproteobacteria bacterium]|jgi:hypothetical protein|nr:hypothetical protein [Alphaproteobacteria bacterium]